MLSRFRGEPEVMDVSDHTVERDAEWQKQTDVIITPDPRLSSAQQDVVAQDYDMTEGQLVLHVRAKLLPYVIKFLQIDLNVREQNPRAQQLVIANQQELQHWLFGAD